MQLKDLFSLMNDNIEINLEDEEGSMSYTGTIEHFIEIFESMLSVKVNYIHPYESGHLRIIIANE